MCVAGIVAPCAVARGQSALSFNGTTQYATMGATSQLNGTTFTVECWFRRDGAGTTASTGSGGLANAIPLVTKGAGEAETPANLNANYMLLLNFSSPNYFLAADFEDNAGGVNHPLVGTTPLAAATWYHAALVSNFSGGNTTLTLYLNGVLEATATFNGVAPESTSIQHFALATTLRSNGTTTAGFFAGVLDEVRFWSVARSQGDIQGTMNLPITSGTGLVARWGLNEGAGLDLHDSVGAAQNGLLVNSPTRTTSANAAPALVAAGETTVVFRQETGVYTGALDTTLSAGATGTPQNTVASVTIDGGGDGATNERHALLRFDNIYGTNPGEIPPGAQIQSAALTGFVSNVTANTTTMHRMLQDWTASATWDSFVGGVQANGVEAVATPDISLVTFGTAVSQSRSADVSLSLQTWHSNPATNFGWVWLPGGTDGLVIDSAEGTTVANRPRLSVTFLTTPNLPPSQPTLISPADMATGITTSPDLIVNVSDPEMTALNVSYYGREAAAPVGADFTIVAMPDTQFYSCNNGAGCPSVSPSGPAIYNGQTQWIVNNRVSQNIAFVAHLGDCVEHGDNGNGSPDPNAEWLVADAALSILENPVTTMLTHGIPYGVAVGNHDQTPFGSPRTGGDEGATTLRYTNFFGLSRFAGRDYYGGRYDFGNPGLYPNNNDNHYQLFSVSGLDFIAIALEWDDTNNATRQAVLAWANGLLQTHSNRRGIVYAHTLINTGNPGSFANQGQATYDALKANPNLFLMLCGHVPGEGRRQDVFSGNTVDTLLSDYQSRSNGGDGWLRLLQFSPANNQIQVRTFSPTRNSGAGEFETDADSQFTLTYDMGGGAPPFSLIGTANSVTSGTNATVPWTGLDANKTYEWYVTVSDGVNLITSPTWTFTTTCTTNGECDDGNPCTDDTCDMGSCTHMDNTASCDDGDLCTTGDTCSNGDCAGTPVSCPMGQVCNPSTGMCEAQPVTLMFQQGLGGYSATVDTFIESAAPTTGHGTEISVTVDLSPLRQILLRFDNVFGAGPNQIPLGSTIQSATLTVNVTNESANAGALLHRMIQTWSDTATWNTFANNGIQADGIEAETTADVSSASGVALHPIDVTSSLVAWSAGATNLGWAFLPPATDNSWTFDSSEGTIPPKLTVTFFPVSQCKMDEDCDDLNPCTDDTCDSGACVNTNNSASCDDGNACTENDTCAGGSCAGTPIPGCCNTAAECDDANPCTDDDCVGNACQYTNNSDACNDGDPCTENDVCAGGLCAGTPIAECCDDDGDCDDADPCTVDDCATGNVAALSFDGTDDYVTMGTASGLNTTTFTLECWFKRTATGIGNTTGTGGIASLVPLVTKGAPEGDTPANLNANYILGIDTSTNTLAVDFEESAGPNHPATSPTSPASNVIALNTWYHAAATYDGTTWRLYLNGDLIHTEVENATPEANSIGRFALATMYGSNGTTYGRFAGVLDEVRVWNYARMQSEIQADMNAEVTSGTGLLGRWGLNEATGTTAGDSTTPAEDGTLTSGPTWVTMDLPDVGGGGCTHTAIPGCCNDAGDCDDMDPCTMDSCVGNVCQHDPIPGCCNNAGQCDDSDPCTDDACVNNVCEYTNNMDACDDGDPCTSDDTCSGGDCAGTPIPECCEDDGDCDDANPCTTDYCATPNVAAVVFDGTNDYITMGPATGLNASILTLECWFRRDGAGVQTSTGTGGLTTVVPLVTKGRGEAESPANLNMNYFLGLSVSGGNYFLAADFEDTATGLNHPITGSTMIGTGAWHHAAATYDGSTWRLYLDGNPEGTVVVGAFTPEATSIQHFGIGSAMTSTGVAAGFFNGAIDEVRVWNIVRTPSEILNAMATEISSAAGLLGRWGLNEATGTAAADSANTPTAENGTLTNGPVWVTTNLPNLGSGGCVHLPIEGCCLDAGDCDDSDICTTDACVNNLCEYSPIANCCHDSMDCDDGDPCTLDECVGDFCMHTPIPDCCSDVGDCDDMNGCTIDACDVQNVAAAEFDGVDDRIAFGAAATHTELGLARFTVECWFNWTGGGTTTLTGGGTGGSQPGLRVIGLPLVSKGRGEADGDNRDLNYFLGVATDVGGGVLAGDFETDPGGSNNAVIGATTITQNTWHHAALSYDGTAMRVYLDGVLDGTFNTTNEPRDDSIQPFGVASAFNSSQAAEGFFAGRIDEVRVWDHARMGPDIADDRLVRIVSAAGMVGRWGLDEGMGASAADSSGNANDGSLVGATWSLMDLPDFGPGQCTHTPAPIPVADAGEDLVLCPSDADPTIGGMNTGSGGTPPYTYAWTGTGAAFLDDPSAANPTFDVASAVPGVYDLCVTVTDSITCSGAADCMTITVGGCITANIDIQGLTAGTVTRDVEFLITSCPSGSELRAIGVTFTPNLIDGVGSATVVLKDVDLSAQWLAVREGHTLRRVAAVDLSATNEDAVNLTDETVLLAGDFHTISTPQDDIVDIIDFAILAARFNTIVSDCVTGSPADCSFGADMNGDGQQGTVDFTALQINFFKLSDALQDCAPSSPLPGRKPGRFNEAEVNAQSSPLVDGLRPPRSSISTVELRSLVPAADTADLTGDGVVDVRDMVSFAQRHGLPVTPDIRKMSLELQQKSTSPLRR